MRLRGGASLTSLSLAAVLLLSGCMPFGTRPAETEACTGRSLAQAALPGLTPLPAWPVPEPDTRAGHLDLAAFATLYEGTEAQLIADDQRGALGERVAALLADQPLQVVRKGVWRALWPQVGPCLAGRPVLRLGYSTANRLDAPGVALLPFRLKEGAAEVPTSALWVAPSRKQGETTWIIATAMGPMDQRSLIYRQPNAGYTLDGPVTVMALDSTDAARTFAADLLGQLTAHRPTEAQTMAKDEAVAAAQAGDWQKAAERYGRLLVLTEREAREPGPPRPDMPFFAKEYQVVELSLPEVFLQMARADLEAGRTVYGAREALLHASYLAEEQGKQDLLAEIRSTMREFIAKDSDRLSMQHRLAELEPTNAEHWWKLADMRIIAPGWEPEPIVAEAEAMGGADPRRAAALYLRQAGLAAALVSPLDFRSAQEKQETERPGLAQWGPAAAVQRGSVVPRWQVSVRYVFSAPCLRGDWCLPSSATARNLTPWYWI